MANTADLFASKKSSILRDLADPEETYSDLSPKGTVDTQIKDLINLINSINGVVTTSSCAGRLSVFQEGIKSSDLELDHGTQLPAQGGKGCGGKWLFVSHDPIPQEKTDFTEQFGLLPAQDDSAVGSSHTLQLNPSTRFIRLQFEPMILHIVTASLTKSHIILSAAMSAGMRESGVQSLRSLNNPSSFPMVAVRSTGMALSSVIGYYDESKSVARSLVNESYLKTIVMLANSRFPANASRIARFKKALESQEAPNKMWEDSSARARRKRREGLQKQESYRRNAGDPSSIPVDNETGEGRRDGD